MKEFKKLKETDIERIYEYGEKRNGEVTDFLTDNVADRYKLAVEGSKDTFAYCLADCESPIEQLLAIELYKLFDMGKFDIPLLVDVIAIENQKEVMCFDAKYRVDFAIYVKYWNAEKCYIVECDGHEFHQKTKEQVERDNKRTRNLQLAGYTVIRFSGTEIFHKPYQCGSEIKRIIQAPAIKFIERSLSEE